MTEHSCAQVVHHALAHLVRQKSLDDAERPGDDGDDDHPAGAERQRPDVVAGDRLECALEQERRDHPECGRHHDQQQHACESQAVGREQTRDAP